MTTDSVIISISRKPAFNLAAEEYLFSQRQDNILFFYINDPCVVIGNNQAIHAEVNLDYCRIHRIEVMRRLSGGGAVYHDNGNLNFCLIRNREEHTFPLGIDYLQPVVKLLNDMDIPVETGKRKDLWLNGFKVSGTAAHIGRYRAMHHGTLLYDANLDHLKNALIAGTLDYDSDGVRVTIPGADSSSPAGAISSIPSPVLNLRSYLESKGQEAMSAPKFFKTIKERFLASDNLPDFTGFTDGEVAAITEIQQSVYQKPTWIYKK